MDMRASDSKYDIEVLIDLICESLKNEVSKIGQKGANAMNLQNFVTAQKILDFLNEIKVFQNKIEELKNVLFLFEDVLNGDSLESSVRLTEIERYISTNFGEKSFSIKQDVEKKNRDNLVKKREVIVEKQSKGLMVKFKDGTIISESNSVKTFVKTIEKIGPFEVHRLMLKCRGGHLVSKKIEFTEPYLRSLKEIKGGWYLQTSGTLEEKRRLLAKISKKLGLGLQTKEYLK